ncbi:hypothetical protein [Ornithobacterium rhinotracheale]
MKNLFLMALVPTVMLLLVACATKKNATATKDSISIKDTLSASYCRNIYNNQKVPNKLKIIEQTCLELYPPKYNLVIEETQKLNNGWHVVYAKDLNSEKKYKIISYNEKKQENSVGDTIRNVILELFPKKFKIGTTEIDHAHNLSINCFKGYMNEDICREPRNGYLYIYSSPDF